MTGQVITYESPDDLARSVADLLVARLRSVQAAGRVPSVVLTGGTIAVKIHEAVATSHRAKDVDWSRVDVWFGDERFVPADSPDRNAGQAAAAMLDKLGFDPARLHLMPASDGDHGDDVDAAAAAYAAELARAGRDGEGPLFDVLMLGIGPDGHCASLFPGRTEQSSRELAVAVRDSPKPPPTRISMTMRTLSHAREVWWVAAGQEKADAVRDAVNGTDAIAVPACWPEGLDRTLWLLDDAAASAL
ncbi:MAG: 6-phosphogluconolactonase [Nocardioides sp.]